MAAGTPLLASDDDINGFLASNQTMSVTSADPATASYDDMQTDASRVIKSQLSGVFPTATLVGWIDPDSTPGTIRAIAGRLIAARWYSKQVTADEDRLIPGYAQQLYNEAIAMLAAIRAGELPVLDDDGVPIPGITTAESAADFWPNNDTPGPYFTMAKKWG